MEGNEDGGGQLSPTLHHPPSTPNDWRPIMRLILTCATAWFLAAAATPAADPPKPNPNP